MFNETEKLVEGYKKQFILILIGVVIATVIACVIVISVSAEDLWLITAYCPCTHCCGPKAQGIIASGKVAKKILPYNFGRIFGDK